MREMTRWSDGHEEELGRMNITKKKEMRMTVVVMMGRCESHLANNECCVLLCVLFDIF